jgi:hypothetical protein
MVYSVLMAAKDMVVEVAAKLPELKTQIEEGIQEASDFKMEVRRASSAHMPTGRQPRQLSAHAHGPPAAPGWQPSALCEGPRLLHSHHPPRQMPLFS